MTDQDKQPKFPETGVDNLIKDFGKKPTGNEVDKVEAMARELQPQYEKMDRVRTHSQQPKQQRKLGQRM